MIPIDVDPASVTRINFSSIKRRYQRLADSINRVYFSNQDAVIHNGEPMDDRRVPGLII